MTMLPDKKISNIAVSIVTYKDDIQDMEECVKHYTGFIPADRLHIIDNSPDCTLESVVQRFGASYIHRPDNPGYGAGHNIAIRETLNNNLDYHLVVNRDIFISEDNFRTAIQYLTEHTEVGALNPKILWPNGQFQQLCKLIPSPLDLIQKLLLGHVPLNPEFNYLWFDGTHTVSVPYLSGSCMFLRTEALKAVGVFDERYFMYPEDIDISRRIAAEYITIMLHESEATHEYGGHSKRSFKMLYLHISNMIRYFNKWGWIWDPARTALNSKTIEENRRKRRP